MIARGLFGRVLAAQILMAVSAGAVAQVGPPVAAPGAARPGADQIVLDGASGVRGVVNVNAAAGANNQQLNLGVIANGGAADALGSAAQSLATAAGGAGRAADARIADGAFAGATGWIAVNGVAGADNQQANVAVIAFGIEGPALADITLSQARASQQPTGTAGGAAVDPERATAIGQGAFEGSSGLVQVSLVGGDRNSSANTFALSVSGGANP